jgi:hypothetical protein
MRRDRVRQFAFVLGLFVRRLPPRQQPLFPPLRRLGDAGLLLDLPPLFLRGHLRFVRRRLRGRLHVLRAQILQRLLQR